MRVQCEIQGGFDEELQNQDHLINDEDEYWIVKVGVACDFNEVVL